MDVALHEIGQFMCSKKSTKPGGSKLDNTQKLSGNNTTTTMNMCRAISVNLFGK